MNSGQAWAPLRGLVRYSGNAAGLGILFMMAVTCVDIVLRRLGSSLPGAYDLVRIAGGITIAAALPLTTAVKGHVAIEYFFHRLGRGGRMVVDGAMRTIQTAGFLFAALAFLRRGNRLLRSGEVMPTLQCPVFWLAWLIAFMCLLTALVSLFHLLRPGRPLLRPGRPKKELKVKSAKCEDSPEASPQRANDAATRRANDATSTGGAL